MAKLPDFDPLTFGLADDLNESWRGQLSKGRAAHDRLARLIEASDIPEPARAYLAWMHDQIARGRDPAEAVAMRRRSGQFSAEDRRKAIYDAVWSEGMNIDAKLRMGKRWILPACKRLARQEVWKKYMPGPAMTAGGIRNLFREMDSPPEPESHE